MSYGSGSMILCDKNWFKHLLATMPKAHQILAATACPSFAHKGAAVLILNPYMTVIYDGKHGPEEKPPVPSFQGLTKAQPSACKCRHQLDMRQKMEVL